MKRVDKLQFASKRAAKILNFIILGLIKNFVKFSIAISCPQNTYVPNQNLLFAKTFLKHLNSANITRFDKKSNELSVLLRRVQVMSNSITKCDAQLHSRITLSKKTSGVFNNKKLGWKKLIQINRELNDWIQI